MRKFLYIFAVIILQTGLYSCNSDEPAAVSPVTDEEYVTVTLSISGDDFPTRGEFGEFTDLPADRLVCGVYDSRGELLKEFGRESDGLIEIAIETMPVSLELTFVKDQQYCLVLWAQNSGSEVYSTGDLRKVGIEYAKVKTIDFSGDAFYKNEMFTVVSNETRNITMRRAVGRLNIRMTEEDFRLIQEKIGPIRSTELSIPGLPSGLDIWSGNEIYEEEFKEKKFQFEESEVITEEAGTILLASVFAYAPQESKEIAGAVLTFIDATGQRREVTLSELPIQRNWTTNIQLKAETVISQLK